MKSSSLWSFAILLGSGMSSMFLMLPDQGRDTSTHPSPIPCAHCNVDTVQSSSGHVWSNSKDDAEYLVSTIHPFDEWLASPSATRNLLEGIRLAQTRRTVLKRLIVNNPEVALAHSVSAEARNSLPEEILKELETIIDGQGSLEVISICGSTSSIDRFATVDGTRYQAYTFGNRVASLSKRSIPMHGIAIDGVMALADRPYRIQNEGPEGITVLSGQTTRKFASKTELLDFESIMLKTETTPGPNISRPTAENQPSASWTTGKKRLIWVRMKFADTKDSEVSSFSKIESALRDVNRFYDKASYGKVSFEPTIVPVVFTCKEPREYYLNRDNSYYIIIDEGIKAAVAYDAENKQDGKYSPLLYDRYIIQSPYVQDYDFGGIAYVGEKGIMINGYWDDSFLRKVTAHELGHNQGIYHASTVRIDRDKPFDLADYSKHDMYGDPFDVMGKGYTSYANFNTYFKNHLHYLPDSAVKIVKSSGLYRIQRADTSSTSGNVCLRLPSVRKNYEYWLEYRHGADHMPFAAGRRLQTGLLIRTVHITTVGPLGSTSLIDLSRSNPEDAQDAAIMLGESFVDKEYDFVVTPVAVGGSEPDQWIDVRISIGGTGNRDPSVSVTPPTWSVAARSNFSLKAVGEDPDGDQVSFRWSFGDNSDFKYGSTVEHNWLTGGSYKVTCTAFDGRGGSSTTEFTVQVTDDVWDWRKITGTPLCNDVVFSGGAFFAVSFNGEILTSTNGETWNKVYYNQRYQIIRISAGDGKLVAAGKLYDTGSNAIIVVSTDGGRTWTEQKPDWASHIDMLSYGNGVWIASTYSKKIYYSKDALNWTQSNYDAPLSIAAFNYCGGLFVLFTYGAEIFISSDGASWRKTYAYDEEYATLLPVAITYHDNQWMLYGAGSITKILVSSDFIKWRTVGAIDAVPGNTDYYSKKTFCVNPWTGLLFGNGSGVLGVSEDGVNWRCNPNANSTLLRSVAVGNGVVVAIDKSAQFLISGSSFTDGTSISRLSNLSIRTRAGTGDATLIAGLTIGGPGTSGSQTVLVRAIGPTLNAFGVTDALPDPKLAIISNQTVIGYNDNWGGGTVLRSSFQNASAFPLDNGSRDAALLSTINPGAYTFQVIGEGTSTGVVLAEVYEASSGTTTGSPKIQNLAARAHVGTGQDILIVGFSISGNNPSRVLIRAIGPKLAEWGISGYLGDPMLNVFSGAVLLAKNDNWGGSSDLINAFSTAHAFTLDHGSSDSAIVLVLPPGSYTAQVSGVADTTGVTLMEIYSLP